MQNVISTDFRIMFSYFCLNYTHNFEHINLAKGVGCSPTIKLATSRRSTIKQATTKNPCQFKFNLPFFSQPMIFSFSSTLYLMPSFSAFNPKMQWFGVCVFFLHFLGSVTTHVKLFTQSILFSLLSSQHSLSTGMINISGRVRVNKSYRTAISTLLNCTFLPLFFPNDFCFFFLFRYHINEGFVCTPIFHFIHSLQ